MEGHARGDSWGSCTALFYCLLLFYGARCVLGTFPERPSGRMSQTHDVQALTGTGGSRLASAARERDSCLPVRAAGRGQWLSPPSSPPAPLCWLPPPFSAPLFPPSGSPLLPLPPPWRRTEAVVAMLAVVALASAPATHPGRQELWFSQLQWGHRGLAQGHVTIVQCGFDLSLWAR